MKGLVTARENEVYAARELIDLGDGLEIVTVFYPKNKLIPRHLRETAIRELERLTYQEGLIKHKEG